jgi:hypothetical protein
MKTSLLTPSFSNVKNDEMRDGTRRDVPEVFHVPASETPQFFLITRRHHSLWYVIVGVTWLSDVIVIVSVTWSSDVSMDLGSVSEGGQCWRLSFRLALQRFQSRGDHGDSSDFRYVDNYFGLQTQKS